MDRQEDSLSRIEKYMAGLDPGSDDADDEDDGDSSVPALLKSKPSSRSGAVALPEPDEPQEQSLSPGQMAYTTI
jgi:hypothetical protein